MRQAFAIALLLLAFAASAFATNYYVSTTGTAVIGNCDFASHAAAQAAELSDHCSLATAFSSQATTGSGDTIYLRGGTYSGKYTSTLDGATVRSFCTALTGGCAANPSEWAIIDGNRTTTLSGDINSSVQTFSVASTAGMVSAGTIGIDTELMQIDTVNSSTSVTVNRGWSPNIGGAVAHTSGATIRLGGTQLSVTGSNSTYRDFEVMSSYTQRDLEPGAIEDEGCCGFYAFIRGAGLFISGGGNSFINLLVHDNLDGFFAGSSSSNTMLYGVITYNNGSHYFAVTEEQGSGNGMYLENSSGYSRIYEVLSLNNFNQASQLYGVSGPYVGGDVQGSAFIGSGTPLGQGARNMLYGPDSQISPTGSVTESHFYHPPSSEGYNVTFGYGAGVTTGTFTNNYVGGGAVGFNRGTVTSLTFTGNIAHNVDRNVLSTNPVGTWNNNTYYNTSSGATKFGNNTTANDETFATWKTNTGDDAASTIDSGNLPTTVIVRPNDYETGRANIIIYAIGQTSANVDLSTTGLTHGQAYVIKNAFDWYGSDVATGTYNSGNPTISVTLNAAATAVAAPVESGDAAVSTPSTTAPNLVLLVVLPSSSQGATVPAAMGGAVKLGGAAKVQK